MSAGLSSFKRFLHWGPITALKNIFALYIKHIVMRVFLHKEKEKEKKQRNRPRGIKRWTHCDETKIINYLKQNREFEAPTARAYYTKFMEENNMNNIYWKLVLYKVRNMRTVYRRAKEYEINKKDSNDVDDKEIRNIMLKICWYVDDFEILFPNDMENYLKPHPKESIDGESSNEESVSINDANNSITNFNDQCLQEQPTASYLPKSIEQDILAVQTGNFNYKRRQFEDDMNIKQEEFDLEKEKLIFEKEKFRQEIRLKEKQIDSRERMKIMEIQMKERIAMRELELKEKLALQSMHKQEPYNSVYHNLE